MAEQYRFPEDERFRRIAAKIADAVMGNWYACKRGIRCPLGCLIGRVHPSPVLVALESDITEKEAWEFVNAWDRCLVTGSPFARLGLAYRARFP